MSKGVCHVILRYSIYKVHSHADSLSRDSLLIISDVPPFVKNFFQVFSNFFELFQTSSGIFYCRTRSPERSDILTRYHSNVKHFFHLFSIFFLEAFSSVYKAVFRLNSAIEHLLYYNIIWHPRLDPLYN